MSCTCVLQRIVCGIAALHRCKLFATQRSLSNMFMPTASDTYALTHSKHEGCKNCVRNSHWTKRSRSSYSQNNEIRGDGPSCGGANLVAEEGCTGWHGVTTGVEHVLKCGWVACTLGKPLPPRPESGSPAQFEMIRGDLTNLALSFDNLPSVMLRQSWYRWKPL